MEQNPPYTAPLRPTTPVSTSAFLPVSTLFKSAWDKTQKHLLRLFLLTILGVVVGLVALLLVAVLVVLAQAIFSGSAVTFVSLAAILIGTVAGVILMLALNIGTMLILAETDPNSTLVGIMRKSTGKILPLLIASILGGFIIMGGLVLFVIPGILFSILLSLSAYYVVLDNVSPIDAMRKSVFTVSKNFGAVFVRMAALIGVSIVISLILNMFSSDGTAGLLVSIASLVFNLIFSWFSVSYMMALFQEAKRAGGEGHGKLMWMVIVAVIGWILIVGGGYLVFRAAANNSALNTTPLQFDQTLLDLDLEELDEIVATAPASVRPASASASVRPTATPRPSAATSSATR